MKARPIETAPKKGIFLAPDKNGDWLRVERDDDNPFDPENPVVSRSHGKWFSPKHWVPVPKIEEGGE